MGYQVLMGRRGNLSRAHRQYAQTNASVAMTPFEALTSIEDAVLSETSQVHDAVHRAYNDNDFVESAVIAAVTDSTLLGYAVGGDLMGAIIGDMLF